MFDRRPLDERRVALEGAPDGADLRAAYQRGREDERGARRRHPVLMTILFVAAAAGVAVLGVAAYEGSFARGGVVVDRNLSAAADQAEPAVRNAAADANQAVQGAGQTLREKAHEATR